MLIISHRGNINGPDKKLENKPSYIKEALNLGFLPEIDLWYDKKWWLGHDEPQYKLEDNSLLSFCILHLKNSEALKNKKLIEKQHFFWHQNDDYAITSKGFIWVYPNKKLLNNSICVMPELGINGAIEKCYAICTDFALKYKIYEK